MARPPEPPRPEDIPPEDRGQFDEAVARIAGWMGIEPSPDFVAPPYFGVLLNSPPIAAAQTNTGSVVKSRGNYSGTYSHADRELVDQVLSYDWDYYGVLGVHTPDAVAVGVRLEAIEAIRDGREEDLTDDERLLVTFIRQVVTGTVEDETYAAIERRLGKRGAIEYTYFCAYLQLVIRLHQAFKIGGPSREGVDQIIDGLRSGAHAVPEDFLVRFQ